MRLYLLWHAILWEAGYNLYGPGVDDRGRRRAFIERRVWRLLDGDVFLPTSPPRPRDPTA